MVVMVKMGKMQLDMVAVAVGVVVAHWETEEAAVLAVPEYVL
jgi:hypothetical protein